MLPRRSFNFFILYEVQLYQKMFKNTNFSLFSDIVEHSRSDKNNYNNNSYYKYNNNNIYDSNNNNKYYYIYLFISLDTV